ncbi:long chain acyl-CoA synthetase 1-like [Olea europaea var. sylvestris]|uniref:long chain acyl-CoA synthetase 1-like n=1 Tax=Olea europaea var. sylvestris TaxID=158386 RepID=UPI000C1D1B2F|nr:long chain acyl-CoA synthetase 1-like [Olea europaea var. sylvestris]XP_022890505.1 long chain acyl-CoA synthetase 1-like [Olea europaea var. sylvestris]XP_022890506.1 long chain acyl-CoA synthetase 1-like [Olea europaea var. sylvestris]
MKKFAVKVEEGKEGRDGLPSVGPVYRNLIAEHAFPATDPALGTAWEMFRASVEKYPGNKMLGWREIINGKWGPYLWKSYEEVYEEVLHVGSALRAHGIEPGARVGIYGSNCPQWIVAMEACSAQSLICVPLYDTLGAGAINYIIDHAEVDFVFIQDRKVKELLNPECTHARRLKLVVCFSSMTEEEQNNAASIGVKSYSWNEFLEMGRKYPSDIVPPQPFNICTIMYTSGTSGDPKGVILTHENISTCIIGVDLFMEQFEDKMTINDVYISFLPLAHILDRMIEEYFFHKGASVGYYHGDINGLRDDLMELRPTFLAGVPRVFERIHEGVLIALQELNPRRRKIFDLLYRYKLYWMKLGYKQKNASPLADLLAFRKVKNRLGGRIRLIVSGGAPLGSEIEEFLRVTSCAFVVQGYGLTESCGLATLGFPDEMCMMGTVGSAFVYTEIRLEEVPEMGYDPLGDPPRGEICIKGRTAFAGYYKNPELTREVLRDGWFHTGDIGEMLPNGVVKIIDRKKNLIKLSQGEYVALEYLEKVYGITPIVEDIWVYGDSFKSMLVAVVVPNQDSIKKWAEQNGHKHSFLELCSLNPLQDYILLQLKLTAERNKLRRFEHIRGVIVEPNPLDTEKDLVTATLKKKRDNLHKRYKAKIDDLYQKLAGNK